MKKRKILLGLAMAAMAVFSLSACGDDNAQSPLVDAGEGSAEGQTGGQTGEGTTGGQEGDGTQGGQTGGNVDESKVVSSNPGEVLTQGEVTVKSSAGKSESASIIFDPVSGAESYNIYVDGTKVDNKISYTQIFDTFVRTDLTGLTAGNHNIEIAAVKSGSESSGTKTKVSLNVVAYDRSGYAHFNYTEGVGAYKDDGTLKDNAIVLYVTDQNKNSVELTYNGKTVRGIGNILNSVGQACGEAGHEGQCKKVDDGKSYYAKANTNQGILLDLAQNNIPLVVRFVGCVSNTGLYKPGTFDASKKGLIEGLTAYAVSSTKNEDGTVAGDNKKLADYGGTVGDNGHMARMKSAKNVTLEGVGSEATLDGWGIHLMAETAYPTLARNFEVRNLAFINTPEDAVGMEGQAEESTLTFKAAVERCWVHHNTFICPNISNPAEGDKNSGDGSCDFKRGNYFTCSYNYFEECHKTNLVGSGKNSIQYNLSYHHNIWYNCGSRMPKARRANIHFYNNLIVGTSSDGKGAGSADLSAYSYMYAENNYFLGAKNPIMTSGGSEGDGAAKLYGNNIIGSYGDISGIVDSREAQVASQCEYAVGGIDYRNFDTNPELFYYDSVNKRSNCYLTSADQARFDCIKASGSSYRTEAGKCQLGANDTNITDVVSSVTVNGDLDLTKQNGEKGKGILKVFTVTSPVTITIAATTSAGYDTGYLLKMDGTLVLALTENAQTAVLENGVYVITSGQVFTSLSGKNDKESTITKLSFASYDSDEFNQKLIADYNTAVAAIPSTIEYNDATYNLIKAAMDKYEILGDLKSQVTNYETNVVAALNEYKNLGKTIVENSISSIGTVTSESGPAISSARSLYDAFVGRFSDVTISNYDVLTAAEGAYSSFAIDACKNAIDAIGDEVTIDSKSAIENAEALYAALDDGQKADVTNYAKLTAARSTYNSLVKIKSVNDAILAANDIESYEEVIAAYSALSASEKSKINTSNLDTMYKDYTIALIESLPATITRANKATIELARNLYDSLSSENQVLVTNYTKLTDAEAVLATLPSEKSTYTSNFSTGWTITGKSTTSMTGSVKNGENITAISTRTFSNIESISVTIQSEDKGTTSYTVYYSADGTNWTEYKVFNNANNSKDQTYTETKSVAGDVYIKVVATCTKNSEKAVSCSSISIVNYE